MPVKLLREVRGGSNGWWATCSLGDVEAEWVCGLLEEALVQLNGHRVSAARVGGHWAGWEPLDCQGVSSG